VVEDSEGERREGANEAEREDWYDEELEALCEGIEMEDDASDGLVDRGEERAYEWLEPPDPEEMEGKGWDEGPEPPDPEETEESERVGPLCEGGVEGVGGAERVGEGEGASKPRRWDRVGGEDLAVSPERVFTHSLERGRRETPGGGWAEYYAEAASVQDEGHGRGQGGRSRVPGVGGGLVRRDVREGRAVERGRELGDRGTSGRSAGPGSSGPTAKGTQPSGAPGGWSSRETRGKNGTRAQGTGHGSS